jgi:short-subunit dehydrogenase
MTGDFQHRYGPWAVIAGASEGIGASLADELAGRGLNLVLIARNEKLLNEVAAGVRDRHGAQVLAVVQDLTDADVAARLARATEGLEIGLVIYNAGASDRTTPFLETGFDHALKQIKLDCIGPVALVDLFAPAMRDRGRGGIVLVASLACVAGSATLVVYSAVKAFQHNFAEGLWAELREYGVDVCCTPLGATFTPALQRMGVEYDPATQMLSEDVAREITDNIRAVASHIWTVDRRTLVEMMSTAAIDFADKREF